MIDTVNYPVGKWRSRK